MHVCGTQEGFGAHGSPKVHCGHAFRAFGTDSYGRVNFCNFHEETICDRHCGIAALHCFLYAMQMLALYISGLYFARIQGNQGAARVPCAGTKLQVNDRKKFFNTNLYEICIFCDELLILLKNKL